MEMGEIILKHGRTRGRSVSALLAVAVLCGGLLWPIAPALAQCVGSGTPTVTCSGTAPTGTYEALANIGNATFTNSGAILGASTDGAVVTGNGDASFANSGTLGNGSSSDAAAPGTGNATYTNSGVIGNNSGNTAFAAAGNASFTNSGTIGNTSSNTALVNGTGNASYTNSGSIGDTSSNQAEVFGAGNATFTNSGTIGNGNNNGAVVTGFPAGGTGNASFTNSGSIGAGLNEAGVNGTGNASFTNSGSIAGGINGAAVVGTGNASFTNSGALGLDSVSEATVTGTGNASFTNSGAISNTSFAIASVTGAGNASFTNSGAIGAGGTNEASVFGNGNATFTNSGSIDNGSTNEAGVTGTGNASFTNLGSISGASNNLASVATGNASFTNLGSIGGASNNIATVATGNASFTNLGSIGGSSNNIATAVTGNASFTNFGSIGDANSIIQAFVTGSGTASLTNFGTIVGAVTVSTPSGTAILTNYAGSRIVGPINMFGGPTALLNFVGGNYLYTLNSLTGVTINTNGAPFAVRGNSVAVLDPTALALEDRSVMNFTADVSSMLQDRFHAMPVSGGAAGGGGMGFAPDTTSRIDDAHNAFSGIPSVSMAYSSTETRNANAMYAKAPALAVPAYDTVVWASGFGGERQQWEDGPIQRARDDAYGGAIGIDRQMTPELRLGAFAGGGNSHLSVAYDIQRVDSDYVFGGGYGRWDKHDYYVDFALFGGGISSSSSRQIADNTVPSGLEMATASYNGWFFSPDVTYGYRIFSGDYVFTPKARVRYVGGTLDGYTEAGSAQGLIMGKRNLSDVEERLGVEFASLKPVTFGGTLKATVEVSGLGLQRLGDGAINAVLLAQNIAFTTPGRSEAVGGAVSVGLDWRPRNNVSLYTSVEGTAMSDKSFSATGKGGIRVAF
jgi:hypothetical protein